MSRTALDVAGAIDRHFEAMSGEIYRRVTAMADQLGETATAGLLQTSPNVITCMPVALLDEDRMDQALDTARSGGVSLAGDEKPADKDWLMLSGNTTEQGFDDPRSAINFLPVIDRLEGAPEFPLAACTLSYEPGTTICTIRADLIDASVELYRRRTEEAGHEPEDVMIANFDADTRTMYRFNGGPYQAQLANTRRRSAAPYLEAYPRLHHIGVDEERFPLTDRLIRWRDYMNTKFELSYAAHYAFNLYGYLDSGGFDRGWDNNEQLMMGRAMANRAAEVGAEFDSLPLNGIMAMVSPRRYVIELFGGQHMGYGSLRVPAEGMQVHPKPDKVTDISEAQFKAEVAHEVQRVCRRGLDRFVAEYGRDHPNGNRSDALDYAYDKVRELVREEEQDEQDFAGMSRVVMRALADFGDEVDAMKAAS